MSKLDDLINEYCSSYSVDYYLLQSLAEIGTGSSDRKDSSENGVYPFYVRSKEVLKIDTYEFDEEAIVIPGEGGIGEIFHYVRGKYALHQRAYRIHIVDSALDTRFLYHYMVAHFKSFIMQKAVSATVTSIRKPMLEQFPVPVPPLEVQREIVRILDDYTERTEKLKAELASELTARKKQYEYYRDALLDFGEAERAKVPKVRLGDIATGIFRGAGIKREEVTDEGIPCVRYGEIYTTYNTWFDRCVSHTKLEYVTSPKYFEYGDILFAITGESVEDIAKSVAYIGREKCLAGGDIVVLKHNQNPRYLAHALLTTDARNQKSKGKVKSKVVHASVQSIEDIEIPLPSLEIQEKIANVLDNFDAICSDLNIGLPAEIEARKLQYEYYRDLLLSFGSQFVHVERERERGHARA